MLTLSEEKNQNTNNIWHSPNSKSNGIYSVDPVTHTNEHDAGSLSSSPLSSPDSKNMQPELQQNQDATENNFNASSRQSSPLSELSNLNDDQDQRQQQQQQQQQSQVELTHNQQPIGSSDSVGSSLISNAPADAVLGPNGNTDESRITELETGLAAEQPAGNSTNAAAILSVTSRQQQTQHQQSQSQQHQQHQHQRPHTNINTSKSSSPPSSQQHHVNGMGVSSPPVRDNYSSSTLPSTTHPPSSSSSARIPVQPQSSDLNPFKPPLDIPDEKTAAIFLLNVELLKVCMEFQTRQLMQTPEFISYGTRLQSNLTWLTAVADQNRQKIIPLPIMTPPALLPWHSPHAINSLYQRLPLLFAKDIARRQAAAALAPNPGPGGGGFSPGTNVYSPLSAGPKPVAPGIPIQPAPPGMMAAGIKRGPPTDPLPDDQNGMRKRVDTGERRHSNPPMAPSASPPHVRSPSVMSNGTGVSVTAPGTGGMSMNAMNNMNNMVGSGMGMQDMGGGMPHHAQMQSNIGMNMGMNMPGGGMGGMGGMPGMQPGQHAHSPHSTSAAGHTSQSSTSLRSSPDVAITQQGQVGPSSLQSHGSYSHQASQSNAANPQLGFGVQGLSGIGVGGVPNMSDAQAQAQAMQMQLSQRARMLQQAQAQAMQSNRSNSGATVPPGAAGSMRDLRMAVGSGGGGGPGMANNAAMAMNMNLNQAQPPLALNPTTASNAAANQMNPAAAAVTNPMNVPTAAGMSMQIQPPPPPNASMVQAIVNAFGPSGLSNYQALQTGSSHPFVSYMLTHVPGFAHLPWQQQLQRMQVVQNNIRQQQQQLQQQQQQQQQQQRMPQQAQVDQRNGVMNPAMQGPATPVRGSNNQGHPQTPIDPTAAGSPFSRQSGSPPNVGGGSMQGMSGHGPRGPQMTPGQTHNQQQQQQQHMSTPVSGGASGMGHIARPGTAGSQSGSAGGGGVGGPMNMKGMGSPGSAPPVAGPGAVSNQNMTPQERQLRLIQQQMYQRGNDGVIAQQAYNFADRVRQQQQQQQQPQQQASVVGMGSAPGQQQQQQQQQVAQGQMGMHPGTVSVGPSSSAGSPPNSASGPATPFGHVPPMGGTAAMGMNMNMGMGMGGMGIESMGGMGTTPNRSAPSPSDMLAVAAARGGGGLAPNMAQKRPVPPNAATQNDMYHQMALYSQAQQRQQHQHQHQQQMAAGYRPGTAMGGMNPAAMAAAAAAQQQQQQQQQQHQQQHQQQQQQYAAGGGTINPGMIYGGGGGGGNGVGNSLGRMQQNHSQQQAYLSQAAQSTGQQQMSQSQPPYHSISPAALQHHPDGMTRIGTPGSVGGGGSRMGGEPSRPGSSASNSASMLPTDGLGGESLESLFNWNGE